ncbi:MAG: AhpC/TSA family protein [Anaerolineales bacterium]
MHCRDWLAQLEQHQDEIRAAGLSLAAIGIGEPKHAERYCGQLAPNVTCLCNKTLEAYRAFGLKEGNALQLAGLKVLLASARTAARGITQGRNTGNTFMLGGVFVIDACGVIRFADYDEYAGDPPNFSDILAAVKQLSVA